MSVLRAGLSARSNIHGVGVLGWPAGSLSEGRGGFQAVQDFAKEEQQASPPQPSPSHRPAGL